MNALEDRSKIQILISSHDEQKAKLEKTVKLHTANFKETSSKSVFPNLTYPSIR